MSGLQDLGSPEKFISEYYDDFHVKIIHGFLTWALVCILKNTDSQ